MTFEVEIAGHAWTVSVAPVGPAGSDGGRFRVTLSSRGTVDDVAATETYELDARQTDLGLSLLAGPTARVVDAAVTALAGGEYLVQLPHVDVTALVDGRRLRRGRPGAASGRGEQRIVAPMPGRVLRVLVRAGDQVEARQGLLVIEAMKMENELAALRPGRVREVSVTEGTSVESGRLLVVID